MSEIVTIVVAGPPQPVASTVIKEIGPKGNPGAAGPNTIETATDIATADLPALNNPLAAALQALIDAVGEKAAQTALDALAAVVATKAPGDHNHDGVYDLAGAAAAAQAAAIAAAAADATTKADTAEANAAVDATAKADAAQAAAVAASGAAITAAIDNLVSGSPGTMDTLNEIAAALGDDPNFAASIIGQLGGKANLAGGNAFDGNQTVNGDVDATGNLIFRNASYAGALGLHPVYTSRVRLGMPNGSELLFYSATSGGSNAIVWNSTAGYVYDFSPGGRKVILGDGTDLWVMGTGNDYNKYLKLEFTTTTGLIYSTDGHVALQHTGGYNVGIGTSAPEKKLHVAQSQDNDGVMISGFDDNASKNLQIYIRDNGRAYFGGTASALVFAGASNYFTATASTYFDLLSGASKLIIRDSGYANVAWFTEDGGAWFSGNVGIGTDSPSSKLHVKGTDPSQVLITFQAAPAQSANMVAFLDAGGTYKASITNTGNFNSGIYYVSGQQALSSGLNVLNLGGAVYWTTINYGNASTTNHNFTNGKVGIGTNSPSAKLQVNGDAIIEDDLIANGTENVMPNQTLDGGDASVMTKGLTDARYRVSPYLGALDNIVQPNQTGIANSWNYFPGNQLKVLWGADKFDANNAYVVPEAGIYQAQGLITFANVADGVALIVGLYKNGSLFGLMGRGTVRAAWGSVTAGFSGTIMVPASAGDQLRLAYYAFATPQFFNSTGGYIHFAVNRVE